MQVETAVRPLLDAYFPPSGVQVLAQPGSFYVASAFSLAVNVIGKKMATHHWDSLAQGELLSTLRLFTIFIFHIIGTRQFEVKPHSLVLYF